MRVYIEKQIDDNEDERQTMIVDDNERMYVGPLWECPEDAIIGRSLVSCVTVSKLMEEAYEAGKRNDPFTVEIVNA